MTCDNLCSLAELLVEDQYTIHHIVFSENFAIKYVNQMLVRVRRAIFIFSRVEYFFSPFSFYVSLLLWSSCCVMRFTISLVQILFFPTICRFFLEVNLFLFFLCVGSRYLFSVIDGISSRSKALFVTFQMYMFLSFMSKIRIWVVQY